MRNKIGSIPKACGFLVCLIGVLVLLGWQWDIPILTSLSPEGLAVNPLAAVLFIVSGITLILLEKNKLPVITLSLLLIVTSLLRIAGQLGMDFQIDAILYQNKLLTEEGLFHHRMSLHTAAAFFLIGMAFIFNLYKGAKFLYISQFFSVAVSYIALLSFTDLVFRQEYFYGQYFSPMPFYAIISFFLLAGGNLFVHPDKAFTNLLLSKNPGGAVLKILLPFAIIIPFIFGFFKMEAERTAFFHATFPTSVIILIIMLLLTALIIWNARTLNKLDKANLAIRELMSGIIEGTSDMIVAIDKDYHIIAHNHAFEKEFKSIYGLDLHHRMPFTKILLPEEKLPFQKDIDKALTGESFSISIELGDKNLQRNFYEISLSPLKSNSGNILGASLIFRNKTVELKDRKELTEAKAKFQAIFNQTFTFIALLSPEGVVENVNSIVLQVSEEKEEDIIGRYFWDCPWWSKEEEQTKKLKNAIQKAANGNFTRYEEDAYVPSGILKIDFSLKPGYDDQGKVKWVIAEGRDITAQKQTEEELSENIRFIKNIAEALLHIIYVYDVTKGNFIYTNRSLDEFLGYAPNELKKNNVSPMDLIHPDDIKIVEKNISEMEEGKVTDFYYRLKNASGDWRYINVRATVYKKTNEGQVWQTIGSLEDVTERIMLQMKLEKSEALLKESQEIARIGSYEIDLVKNEVRGTAEYLKLHGITEDIVLTKEDVIEKIHPDDRERVQKRMDHAMSNKQQIIENEFRAITAEGKLEHYWTRASFSYNKDGNPVRHVGIIMNITKRKKAEQEIQNIKEFVFLADSLPQLIWTAKTDGRVDYVNQRFCNYTGMPAPELMDWGWKDILHPSSFNETVEKWKKSVEEGKPFEVENCLRRYDGAYRWFLVRSLPMKNMHGEIIKWIGSNTDIQENKEKNRQLQETNSQLQKINIDLDNFIYTASHDLKAPINNLEGLTGLLYKESGGISSKGTKVVSMIKESIHKLKDTIHDLTEISKIQKNIDGNTEPVYFKDIVQESLKDLQSQIFSQNAIIHEEYEEEYINFNKKNLKIIIDNLLSNSLKYSSPDRAPEIFIKTFKQDKQIVLKVKDNGLGFDMKQTDKIFTMFRRLHDHVKGTGVGLYIVKRILENTRGKIEATSEVGKGAEFTVYFSS